MTTDDVIIWTQEKDKKHARSESEADGSKDTPVTGGDIVYLNRMIESMQSQIDNCGSAISEIHTGIAEIQEAIGKLEGMVKFCYAICQNPGIKDLADANRNRPRAGGFSFAPKLAGVQPGGQSHGAAPWRP